MTIDSQKLNDFAAGVLQSEGQAISAIGRKVPAGFAPAAKAIFDCTGQVILTGIGKAGLIGQKISATFASTGTHSIFLHPVEALHGDLGRVRRGDVVLALSHSGQTEEIIRLLDHLKGRGATLIAMTASADSPLGKYADIVIAYGNVEEACPLGLAPTVSTSCMLALGDALALCVMKMRNFTPEDFAEFHPAGSLGRKLLKVEEVMTFKAGEHLAAVGDWQTLGQALSQAELVSRRSGALLLIDSAGRLSGILTDADLRRQILKHEGEDIFSIPVASLMTKNPKHVKLGDLASHALCVLNRHRIDELPVLDNDGKPVGIIDVQDLLGIKTFNDERD